MKNDVNRESQFDFLLSAFICGSILDLLGVLASRRLIWIAVELDHLVARRGRALAEGNDAAAVEDRLLAPQFHFRVVAERDESAVAALVHQHEPAAAQLDLAVTARGHGARDHKVIAGGLAAEIEGVLERQLLAPMDPLDART